MRAAKQAREPAADEFEKRRGPDRARGEIGRRNQVDAADESPRATEKVEQPPGPAAQNRGPAAARAGGGGRARVSTVPSSTSWPSLASSIGGGPEHVGTKSASVTKYVASARDPPWPPINAHH